MYWDKQFCITASKDNTRKPVFLRKYFDNTPSRVIWKDPFSNQSPSLKASISQSLERIGTPNRIQRKRELQWNGRFNVIKQESKAKMYSSTRDIFRKQDISQKSMMLRNYKLKSKNKIKWNRPYNAISENNLVKHKHKRKYFS